MKARLLSKQGNTPMFLVMAAIVISAIVLMGIAFATNIKGSVYRSFVNQNTGFDYYTENIADDVVD